MKHRHLELEPGTDVRDLPSAALLDILDRGDLDAWRPIVVAVAEDPFGPLATRLLELVDAFPMYGTSPLWRAWIDRRRAREEGRRAARPRVELRELRRRAGLTQAELASRVGMSQSDLSKLERRRDVRLSSLASYVKALRFRDG